MRRVGNGSADPKFRQMRGAFRRTISQLKRWTSNRNLQTNCCCLWQRYESAKCDEVVPWILRRKNWRLRRTKSGRPSFISYDFLQEIEGEIRSNRRVSIRELHRIIPEVSKTTIREAATEKLGYRKLCARWVPKMLADDHKTKRMGSALKFLTLYAQKGDEFLDYIATGDETWVFHHTP